MPSACNDATVLHRVTDKTAFQTWHDTTSNLMNATPFTLETLKSIEKQITDTVSCVQEQIRAKRSLPNSNYTLQEEVVVLQKKLDDASDDVKTAKERAQSITNLQQKVNQTESWFPLGRPLQQLSLFILVGISIFFTMMTIGLVASYFGFELNLSWVPGPLYIGQTGSIWRTIYSWINPLSLALVTSLFVTLSIITWLRTK